jgi:signal transduction histidine kinase
VRTKLSSTAHESDSEVHTPAPCPGADQAIAASSLWSNDRLAHQKVLARIVPIKQAEPNAPSPGAQQDEGLLHDVRNLVSAVSLYCDLLSMPHVLRPEHRHYADELRLLGEGSAALIERLIGAGTRTDGGGGADSPSSSKARRALQSGPNSTAEEPPRFEGLRPMVERSAALLHCVASGQVIEIVYGDASALAVRVPAQSVERILVNLVRNAAAAMGRRRGNMRVGVGLQPGDALRTRPWPFQRVRLTVEDSGCGMAPAAVQRLLASSDPLASHLPCSHGIGFRVVRELVEASRGDLWIQSRPGQGTRVEIEWPVAQLEGQASAHCWVEAQLAGETRRSA